MYCKFWKQYVRINQISELIFYIFPTIIMYLLIIVFKVQFQMDEMSILLIPQIDFSAQLPLPPKKIMQIDDGSSHFWNIPVLINCRTCSLAADSVSNTTISF